MNMFTVKVDNIRIEHYQRLAKHTTSEIDTQQTAMKSSNSLALLANQ
jgi:hypothetical protein